MRPREPLKGLRCGGLLFLTLLLAGCSRTADAQVVDRSGSGPLAQRVDAVLQEAARGRRDGDRFYLAFAFEGLLPSDAIPGSGGILMLQRADGWTMSGMSGLLPVTSAWPPTTGDSQVIDLATMQPTTPSPPPTLERRPMIALLGGRIEAGEGVLRDLNLRQRSGSLMTRGRPFFWIGDAGAQEAVAWARGRIEGPQSSATRDLSRDLVGLISLIPQGSGVPGVLEALSTAPEDGELRRRAIAYLGRRPEDTTAVLRRLFADAEDPEDRGEALQALADRIGPASQPQLIQAARDSEGPEAVRRTAINYLSRVPGREADGVLEALLADPDPDLRRRVVAAWERREAPRAVPLLERVAMQDAEERVRRGAVASIGDIEGDTSTTALQRIFDASQDEKVRVGALEELVPRRNGDTVAWLSGIARGDASLELRKQAVRQLGRLNDPAAQNALKALLDIGRR